MFGRKKADGDIKDPVSGNESQMGLAADVINPTSPPESPMQNIGGMVGANPHMHLPNRGQEYDKTPITFNRIGTRWCDTQLSNGLRDGIASGRINSYRGEGWYDVTVPIVPGQTRLVGGNHPGYFVPKGGAPSQWQDAFNSTAGAQPGYPGGPGYLAAPDLFNPGSGG